MLATDSGSHLVWLLQLLQKINKIHLYLVCQNSWVCLTLSDLIVGFFYDFPFPLSLSVPILVTITYSSYINKPQQLLKIK